MRVRLVWQALACLVVAVMMTSCDNPVAPVVSVNPPSTPAPGATATPTASGFTVTITIGGGDGTGIVTASPIGPSYPPGTVVTLTAVADAGSCFGGWTASCQTFGQKAVCTVTISASTKVGAEFDKVCSTPTPAPTSTPTPKSPATPTPTPAPTYCHSIVAALIVLGEPGSSAIMCPTGATQFCDTVPIVATSSAQAHAACDACYGPGACVNDTTVGMWGVGGSILTTVFVYQPGFFGCATVASTGHFALAGEIDDAAVCPLVPPSRWAP
jgi:hypothetical protein